jgi:hypothetical protein
MLERAPERSSDRREERDVAEVANRRKVRPDQGASGPDERPGGVRPAHRGEPPAGAKDRADPWIVDAGLMAAMGLGSDPAGAAAGAEKGAADGGTPMEFPYASAISASTGAVIPGSAVHDPSTCDARGLPAFTDGMVSHFASKTPPLHVAAHEATHQLQHSGISDAGLGAERHAHEVANAVSAGTSSRELLSAPGSSVAPAVRNYTEFSEAEQTTSNQWKTGGLARVGDEGRTVTTSVDKHACYADPKLIVEANAILKAKKSGVNLEPGAAGPSGEAPDGSGIKTTVKVDYKILGDKDNKEFLADCGHSAREVQGGAGQDSMPHGVYTDGAGTKQNTAGSMNPAVFRDEIYVKGGLGPDGRSAHAAYNALSPSDKDAFDKKHGINKYAAPGVGEAFTRRRDDEQGGTGFNFHWGGVVMVAGGDRVTFENYTKGKGYDAKDEDWYFATYGPPSKPGQTWHERWKSVGGDGKGTTIAAATSADPSPFTKVAATLTTSELISKYKTSVEAGEKMALESEMRNRWIKVTVVVKAAQEGTDDVYVKVSHSGREAKTGVMKMGAGAKNTFWISLDPLAPVTGKISVGVYDYDSLSADDLISNIGFDAPYSPQVDNRPWDDAEYHTTVEFDR